MGKKDKLFYKDLPGLKFIILIPILISLAYPFAIGVEKSTLTYKISQVLHQFELTGYGLFFLISTFLLTSLGLREKEYFGKFSLKRFFVRRSLRILPLYLIILLFSYLIVPFIADFMHVRNVELPKFYWSIGFISNYYKQFYSTNYFYSLQLLWSIGLLVQFNLINAIILKFFSQKSTSTIGFLILGIGIIAKLTLQFLNIPQDWLPTQYLIYFGSGLVLGAMMRNKKHPFLNWVKSKELKQTLIIYIVGCAIIIGMVFLFGETKLTFLNDILVCIFIAFVICDQIYNRRNDFKLRNSKIFNKLGRYSYGIYIYLGMMVNIGLFVIVLMEWKTNSAVKIIFPVACILSAIVIALASYRIFEKPILRLRRIAKRA